MNPLAAAIAEHDRAVQSELEILMPLKLRAPGSGFEFPVAGRIAPGEIVVEDGGVGSKEVLRARFAKDARYTPAENTVVDCNGQTWMIREVEGKEPYSTHWSIRAVLR